MKVIVFLCVLTVSVISLISSGKNIIEILEKCIPKSTIGDDKFFEVLRPPGLDFFETKNRAQKCFVACYYENMEIVSFNLKIIER